MNWIITIMVVIFPIYPKQPFNGAPFFRMLNVLLRKPPACGEVAARERGGLSRSTSVGVLAVVLGPKGLGI